MMLIPAHAYRLLERYGVYSLSACDKCGQLLGAVRYTRKNEAGEWCSRVCRGDRERPLIRRGGRPRKYKTNAERQRVYRASLGVTKHVNSPQETKDLQTQYRLSRTYPLTPLFPALETACRAKVRM